MATQTERRGLFEEDVIRLTKIHGKNILPHESFAIFKEILEEIISPFNIILIAAGCLSIATGHKSESIFVFLCVFFDVFVSVYQKHKADNSLAMLARKNKIMIETKRDGSYTKLSAEDLLPGDICKVIPGSVCPADASLVSLLPLHIDESLITGESVPREIGPAAEVLAGSIVAHGNGEIEILRTGRNSSLGLLADKIKNLKRETIFMKSMSELTYFIIKILGVMIVLAVALKAIIEPGENSLAEYFLFGAALAVSVIPEGLPLVLTYAFSRGATKLAKQGVLVKRLSSVEDLGAITTLCLDKTGTITENSLKVVKEYPAVDQEIFRDIVSMSIDINKPDKDITDPFEKAIRARYPYKAKEEGFALEIGEKGFDPTIRRSENKLKMGGRELTVIKGTFESVSCLIPGSEVHKKELELLESEFLRSLAFAYRYDNDPFIFVGMVGFTDPLRESSAASLEKARDLSIKLKVISGDSAAIVKKVTEEAGFDDPEDDVVIGGEYLSTLSPTGFRDVVTVKNLFARVNPDQKLRIISLLQERSNVGYVGDGINDVAALHAAGVSIAVSNSTDVARESADIVLQNKSLHTLINSIEEGRMIFKNALKYIRATLASNFGNFIAVIFGLFFYDSLPMTASQLLLLNLVTDFPMLALGSDKVALSEVASPQRYHFKKLLKYIFVFGLLSGAVNIFFFFYFSSLSTSSFQTHWFITSALVELLFVLSARTTLPFWKATLPSFSLFALCVTAALAAIVIPFTAIGHTLFSFTNPSITYITPLVIAFVLYMIANEVVKHLFFRKDA